MINLKLRIMALVLKNEPNFGLSTQEGAPLEKPLLDMIKDDNGDDDDEEDEDLSDEKAMVGKPIEEIRLRKLMRQKLQTASIPNL